MMGLNINYSFLIIIVSVIGFLLNCGGLWFNEEFIIFCSLFLFYVIVIINSKNGVIRYFFKSVSTIYSLFYFVLIINKKISLLLEIYYEFLLNKEKDVYLCEKLGFLFKFGLHLVPSIVKNIYYNKVIFGCSIIFSGIYNLHNIKLSDNNLGIYYLIKLLIREKKIL